MSFVTNEIVINSGSSATITLCTDGTARYELHFTASAPPPRDTVRVMEGAYSVQGSTAVIRWAWKQYEDELVRWKLSIEEQVGEEERIELPREERTHEERD